MNRYNLNEVQFPDTPFPLMENCILLGKRGSEAHNCYVPPTDPDSIDDRDLLGVLVPPLPYYFGIKQWDHAEAIKGCWDVVLYGLPKFLSLVCKQNPNVLSMLWIRPEDYLHLSPAGRLLVAHRSALQARKPAYDAFVGYARGQFKRMTNFKFEGYMGAKRRALAERYGYDCKNAAHLIRLLTMGEEYLGTGEMKVYREADRDFILAIKQGKWPLEEVKLYAQKLFDKCEKAYYNSSMVEKIDHDLVNELSITLHRMTLKV